ncbi:amidohydrolase family protein [Marinibaculum pumilum]|uniref:Amidohydrolase family protein n=1 Tax=Marinibaculum pumilum TaxID=1766165 RepID=A0ABV7KZN4_9PROT
MQDRPFLIRGAAVLSMDPAIGDLPAGDILVQGDRIAAIGHCLDAPEGAEILDAAEMIAVPGFVDTHRHVWQTQLRSVATDWSLCDYTINMRSVFASFYQPEDVWLGNHIGALEALNAGITSVVDHCHIVNSPEHADAAVQGHRDAGIGGVFCYGMFRNARHHPGAPIDVAELIGEMWGDVEDWRFADAERLRGNGFGAHDRLRFGLATNEFELKPYDEVQAELRRVIAMEPQRISMHAGMGALAKDNRMVKHFLADGLLDERALFVHGGGFTDEELRILADHGCAISATPDTEMQMAMGHPVAYRFADAGGRASLGIDIVSNIGGDMFSQMRLMLQAHRAWLNAWAEQDGRTPGTVTVQARSILEMATIGGARAIGMDDCLGSLSPGKFADIALIDTRAINMTPMIDPVGAVIFYANPSNVDTVLAGGRIVKRGGQLTGIDWPALRRRLIASSDRVLSKAQRIPLEKIQALWTAPWYFDRRAAIEAVS